MNPLLRAAVAITFSLAGSYSALAEYVEYTQDNFIFELDTDEGKCRLIGVVDPDAFEGKITIPASISVDEKEYDVKGLAKECLANCRKITEIIVRQSKTESYAVGNGAFTDCRRLEKVDLPANTTSIFNNAFSGCENLMSLTCRSLTVPSVNDSYGSTAYLSAVTCYVPESALDLYLAAFEADMEKPDGAADKYSNKFWSNLKEILAIDEDEIEPDPTPEPGDDTMPSSTEGVSISHSGAKFTFPDMAEGDRITITFPEDHILTDSEDNTYEGGSYTYTVDSTGKAELKIELKDGGLSTFDIIDNNTTVNVVLNGSTIEITGLPEGENMSIVDIQGRPVAIDSNKSVRLSPGVYIINTSLGSIKIRI